MAPRIWNRDELDKICMNIYTINYKASLEEILKGLKYWEVYYVHNSEYLILL